MVRLLRPTYDPRKQVGNDRTTGPDPDARMETGPSASSGSDRSDDSFDALLKDAAHISNASSVYALASGDTLANGRFVIRRALGRGGMGTVYEAWDEEHHALVALKTLTHTDPGSLYYLKNEFRSLSEVTHPNLVALHEFFSDRDRWFFSMELIRGPRFDMHVRDMQPDDPESTATIGTRAYDEARLRNALRQLVQGVQAIHAAGKLHRDLKPANVLVDRGERVVILDFGLASEQADDPIGGPLL